MYHINVTEKVQKKISILMVRCLFSLKKWEPAVQTKSNSTKQEVMRELAPCLHLSEGQ